MPRTRSAPAVYRPRRRYPAKDDPARLALAGRIPDAALGALIGCGRSAVSAWRRTRTPPVPAFAGPAIPAALWPDVAALSAAAGASARPGGVGAQISKARPGAITPTPQPVRQTPRLEP